ncbi:hypothetical protein [Escherichia coli]|nr:hypothetical protein [Escherichia coli]
MSLKATANSDIWASPHCGERMATLMAMELIWVSGFVSILHNRAIHI